MIFIIYESPRMFNSAGQKGIHQEQHKAEGYVAEKRRRLQSCAYGRAQIFALGPVSTGGTKDLRKPYLEVKQIGRL